MVKNYLTKQERDRADSIIDQVLMTTQMSYPDNSLIDIIRYAIPGVQIVQSDFDGDGSIRGIIFKKTETSDRPKIAIQQNLSPEAKTFALAHEFGHFMLGHPGDKNFFVDRMEYDGSNRQQLEAQAQYFAASLLMPAEKFAWLASVLSEEELAKRFGVSVAAVRVRKKWVKSS